MEYIGYPDRQFVQGRLTMRRKSWPLASLLTLCLLSLWISSGLSQDRLGTGEHQASLAIKKAVLDEINVQHFPGAVVLVAQSGKILLHEAYGGRAILPQPEEMTKDTIFDMASMTKPIVTATCVMKLVEQGKLKL